MLKDGRNKVVTSGVWAIKSPHEAGSYVTVACGYVYGRQTVKP